MTINELKTSLSSGEIKNIYLFYGCEEYLIKLYISRIRDEIIANPALADLNYTVYETFDTGTFEDAINTLPAFSDKKLIIFNETGIFKNPDKSTKEYLETALLDIPDHVTVIFREKEIDSRLKKLLGAVEKSGASVKFDYMTEAQLKTWINSIITKQGKKISVPDIEYLISCTGSAMSTIENETKKLCSFATNDIISKQNIDEIVTKSLENRVLQLSECIFSKNIEKALTIISELKLLKEKPIKISALISTNLCNMYKVKTASPQNRTPQKLGMHPYVIKLNTQSPVTRQTLSKLISNLSVTDEKMKSTPHDSWTLLEHFVMSAAIKDM